MMNVKNIIQQGEDAKYNIRIEREGFSMQDNDFRLTLKWGMQEKQLVIKKSQMMDLEAGNWLFIFPTKILEWNNAHRVIRQSKDKTQYKKRLVK